jgi:hypothetical protein
MYQLSPAYFYSSALDPFYSPFTLNLIACSQTINPYIMDSQSFLHQQPPLEKITMASSTPPSDTTSSTSEDQAWVDLLDSLIHQSSLRPVPVDEDYPYYTTTFHDETVFRWEVQRGLDYTKSIYMHLQRVLSLISTHGEEALSSPSPVSHFDIHAVMEGGIAEESGLEKAQHSFAVHHTAISECLKALGSSWGLPSYEEFRKQRNWFCHDYCTPDAEYEGKGMAWAVRGGKEKFEDLLQEVVTPILALTALMDDETAWMKFEPPDWKTEIMGEVNEEKEKDEKDEDDSGYDIDGDDCEMELTLDSSEEISTPSSEVEATTPDANYYEHDDGILTRPFRFLYFHSRLCRNVMEKICNIMWNRRIEYCTFHGVDTPEEMDGRTEGEVAEMGIEMEIETASIGG